MENSSVKTQKKELIKVNNLVKHFAVDNSDDVVKAVDGISFNIFAGETLGLVGESGCGKSTVGRCVLRLIEPTSGEVFFEGKDVLKLGNTELREMRREMQIIFQDPYASLNPRLTVLSIISEPLKIHKIGNKTEQKDRVAELLSKVGLDPNYMHRYPHEFSGGQRQRLGIARALALNPKLIIADEPIVALDVYHQLHIMELLAAHAQQGGAVIAALHDLSLASRFCTRLVLMNHGKLVAQGKPVNVLTPENLAEVYSIRAHVDCRDDGVVIIPVKRVAHL